MSQLTYLVDEICCGLEIYFSGRAGGQYSKTAFILCDDYVELLSKLFLLNHSPSWSDRKPNGQFKNFHNILSDVETIIQANAARSLPRVKELQQHMQTRRDRRNDFFHTTHLLDLNVSTRSCVEAFCDLLEYGHLLFPNEWPMEIQACRQMETLEVLLLLERKSFNDAVTWSKVNEILRDWPRRDYQKQTISKKGTQYAQHPEDLHLRMCVLWGGPELCQRLKALL